MLNLTIELFNDTNGKYSYFFGLDEIVKATDMIEKSQDEITGHRIIIRHNTNASIFFFIISPSEMFSLISVYTM